jgi:hypothetical protein
MYQLWSRLSLNYDNTVLWAAMTLAFFGCLRASEFCVTSSTFSPTVNLCLSDVSFLSSGQGRFYNIHIKRSKTDTLNKGFQLPIGCSECQVCAYCSMRHMLALRSTHHLLCDPDSPLFLFMSGSHLTKVQFVTQIRLYLALAGLDSQSYSGHSFRAGSATSAALSGLSDWEIQLLGRWTSSVYQSYIRAPQELIVGFSKRLAKQPGPSYTFRQGFIDNVI